MDPLTNDQIQQINSAISVLNTSVPKFNDLVFNLTPIIQSGWKTSVQFSDDLVDMTDDQKNAAMQSYQALRDAIVAAANTLP